MFQNIFITLILFTSFSFSQIREIDLFLDKRDKRTLERELPKFIKTYKVPGITFVLANKGKIVYAKSFGLDSIARKTELHPKHKMAIANNTQIITAISIIKLLQEGKVSLEDKLFGPKSIFEKEIPKVKKLETEITVRHLLEQTVGHQWPDYTTWLNFKSEEKFVDIRFYISKNKLTKPPGKEYYNSKFCYMLLGEIIKKKTGKKYIEFLNEIFKEVIQSEINLISDVKIKDLATHYDYKKTPHTLTKSHITFMPKAGLVCSPVDFMNILLSVSNNPPKKNILIEQAIKILKAPSELNNSLGKGFFISSNGNYYHHSNTGVSSSAFNMRSDGVTWVLFTNGNSSRKNFSEKVMLFGDEITDKLKTLP